MKKTTFFEALKIGLGSIPSLLFRFIKKLFVILWFYAYMSIIPLAIAFVVMYFVKTFAPNAAVIVFKILATIGQIIPLSFSLYSSEYELVHTDEDSAELCFAICAVVITALWLK